MALDEVTLDFVNALGTPGHTNFDITADVGPPPVFHVYREQTMTLDATQAGVVNTNANAAVLAPSASAGQGVKSYFFHMDNGTASSSGSVVFDTEILAVFTGAGHSSSGGLEALQNTDPVFGLGTVTMYGQTTNPTFRGTLEQTSESIIVSGNTITWANLSGGRDGLEQFRVLIAARNDQGIVPEPSIAIAACLVGTLGFGRRCRR